MTGYIEKVENSLDHHPIWSLSFYSQVCNSILLPIFSLVCLDHRIYLGGDGAVVSKTYLDRANDY